MEQCHAALQQSCPHALPPNEAAALRYAAGIVCDLLMNAWSTVLMLHFDHAEAGVLQEQNAVQMPAPKRHLDVVDSADKPGKVRHEWLVGMQLLLLCGWQCIAWAGNHHGRLLVI